MGLLVVVEDIPMGILNLALYYEIVHDVSLLTRMASNDKFALMMMVIAVGASGAGLAHKLANRKGHSKRLAKDRNGKVET